MPIWSIDFDSTKNLPTAYQGRFRSLDSAARLWLQETYHKQNIKKSDLPFFHTESGSALNLLWMYHFQGNVNWDNAPFFWIHYSDTKELLGLNLKDDRFSYNQLMQAFYHESKTNLLIMKQLISQEFITRYDGLTNKLELTSLTPGLWVALKNHALYVINAPKIPPWHFLTPDLVISQDIQSSPPHNKQVSEELIQLLHALKSYKDGSSSVEEDNKLIAVAINEYIKQAIPPKQIEKELADRFPLSVRLQRVGTSLKMLPKRHGDGEWISLHALGIKAYDAQYGNLKPVSNFTIFSQEHFENLRQAYLNLQKQQDQQNLDAFVKAYEIAYAPLAGKQYRNASSKYLNYPTVGQLSIETTYHRAPLTSIIIGLYLTALLLFIAAIPLKNHYCDYLGLGLVLAGFFVHSLLLGMRCYILGRPPVSNMFETVIYVPWVTMLIGLIMFYKQRIVLIAGCIASIALLLLLQITYDDSKLENVQAVLDSQYWLLIHVLMVVGSYGAFLLCGILGHFYLASSAVHPQTTHQKNNIARSILYTMYAGVALLIPGTILGGVWAAESWGRFWDWDPKESWAFISTCVYLLVIHAYTFRRIGDLGLAIGSIGGLIAISFTWYGVNYVLGTGLHSYGFGKGGEGYYFSYIALELLFIALTMGMRYTRRNLDEKIS